jgi:NAD(P)-dependent dehydrogenase (short-subunit alcohol dehydrogenase family)
MYVVARHTVPHMILAGRGAIINIASTRALMSEPDGEPYGASKGGVLALTHAMAISLGRHKIRVNAISPGWIHTTDDPLRPEDHAQHPVGRVGRPEDVAAACVFLAAPEESGFMTGQNLVLDGGMTVKMIYV